MLKGKWEQDTVKVLTKHLSKLSIQVDHQQNNYRQDSTPDENVWFLLIFVDGNCSN